jgi:L-ascorbate metabolism protein UlaG (beta-lactamase superfamily)
MIDYDSLDDAHRRRQGTRQSWLRRYLGGLLAGAPPKMRLGPQHVLPTVPPGGCAITPLGHATVLVRYSDARLLVDPCFANSLQGLRRARPAVVAPGALDGIDGVLCSHDHIDHLHPPSLATVPGEPPIIVPRGTGAIHGISEQRIFELDIGDRRQFGGATVTAVKAWHRVGMFGGRLALGFVIQGDGPTVYVSGDTGLPPLDEQSALADLRRQFQPAVAVLPISSYRPLALRKDHLSPLDALAVLDEVGADLLVPVHHSAFALGYESLAEPLAWLRSLVSQRGIAERVAFIDAGASLQVRRRALAKPQTQS